MKAGIAIDAIGDLAVLRRCESDVQRLRRAADGVGPGPHDVLESQPDAIHRRPRHFEIGDARQNLLARHDMIGEEELGAGEDRSEALLRRVRSIAMDQRMTRRRLRQPVALPGKG